MLSKMGKAARQARKQKRQDSRSARKMARQARKAAKQADKYATRRHRSTAKQVRHQSAYAAGIDPNKAAWDGISSTVGSVAKAAVGMAGISASKSTALAQMNSRPQTQLRDYDASATIAVDANGKKSNYLIFGVIGLLIAKFLKLF